eukprot:TRINITY_DN8862_c1_g1_i1.p1 TRINITY_DN8862_c1_g1~~TRINITY_DN8862_c1_g1_i1.p1  ORF type:complete len:199 (+),score=8.69 TRINITY_DN8862_c1_g1_i1:128-724(+)
MYNNPVKKASVDYDEEARKLFRKLGLPEDGSGVCPGRYNPMDVIWKNKKTGAQVFVGGYMAAQDKNLLNKHNVSCVVNCQDETTTNYFEKDSNFSYVRFPVAHWRRAKNIEKPEVVRNYFGQVFAWIEQATDNGRSVLIHCLAGAHRAGTTGTAFLMYATGMSDVEAIRSAKKLRPAIDPISDFPVLLKHYSKAVSRE